MVPQTDRLSDRVTAQSIETLDEVRTQRSEPAPKLISHVEWCDEMQTLSRRWLVEYMQHHITVGEEAAPLKRTREEWKELFISWLG